MKVLFDQGAPAPLRRALIGHEVSTAFEMAWSELTNGELLAAAESHGFDALVTTDQSIPYQQHVAGRGIGVLILLTTDWNTMRLQTQKVVAALSDLRPGEVRESSFDE